jgi:(2R)-phospho-3-sulfolactate synthase (ComA)
MVRAISAAEPLNVPAGGCAESVVTPRTHFRFCVRRFVEVEGIDLVEAANVAVQADGRNVLAGSDTHSKRHAGAPPWESLSTLLQLNRRGGKPRSTGLTETRGPYYSVMGSRYLTDVLETMGTYIDSLKFAGGSFCLMPEERVREIIELCHRHDVLVSTGGFLERALPLGPDAVERCLDACRALGFDTIEVSSGFITAPADDLLALAKRALDRGFHVKPEVGVQFGA